MSTARAAREAEFSLPIGYTDEEGNTHRSATLRKMTGKEEAILADPRHQRNGGKLVTALLHSCVTKLGDTPLNGTGPVARLYSADRNFLLLKLRSLTFGNELEASYTCPSCGEVNKIVEDLDDLPVRTLADGESPEEITIELDDGYVDKDGNEHTALRLRLPNGVDEETVAPQMRKNASLGKNALLSRCMVSLGDVPKHRLDAMGSRILADLTMTDRRKIDRAINQAAPGVDLLRELDCMGCGESFKASLDMTHFLALE